MTSFKRIALGLAIAMPLAVACGCAFAFSYTEGPPGYSSGNTYTDPDAQFDDMSDHMNQMYGTDANDDGDLTSDDSGAASSQNSGQVMRLPTNIGANR